MCKSYHKYLASARDFELDYERKMPLCMPKHPKVYRPKMVLFKLASVFKFSSGFGMLALPLSGITRVNMSNQVHSFHKRKLIYLSLEVSCCFLYVILESLAPSLAMCYRLT